MCQVPLMWYILNFINHSSQKKKKLTSNYKIILEQINKFMCSNVHYSKKINKINLY